MNINFENLLSLSHIFIPVLTSVLGYFFGRWHQLFLERRSLDNKRFQSLYLPFQKLYFKKINGAYFYLDMPNQLQSTFLEMLIDNYELADSELQRLIMEFKWVLNASDSTKQEINDKFYEICLVLDNTYRKLAKKLYYPVMKI